MLARYAPSTWARDIDVDQSRQAVALEQLLNLATFHLPDYISAALGTVLVTRQ